jgi:hypothetical protein
VVGGYAARGLGAVAAVAMLLAPVPGRAAPVTVLTAGKFATFARDASAPGCTQQLSNTRAAGQDAEETNRSEPVSRCAAAHDAEPAASVRVTGDPALSSLTDPRCPATSAIAFAYATQAQTRTDYGETSLPCGFWQATRTGFRYHDPAGSAAGVRDIVYEGGRLSVQAGGPKFGPITGPAIFVETFFRVADQRYLVRFYDFQRNDSDRIVTRVPSRAAAAAEAAFWKTLSGWGSDDAHTLALLQDAVRSHPSDGRSQFYLGAFNVYLAASTFPPESGLDALGAAQDPLDRAVELLPHDSVPKAFRALARYLNGVYRGDAAEEALGQTQLEEAATANLFFNKAVALFILPQFVSGTSDYYQTRLLGWLDDLSKQAVPGNDAYPDVFTSRLVPHDPESATLMFGDVAAKGGRLAQAETWYTISQSFGAASGYPFQGIAAQRLALVRERLAAQQNGPDPSTSSLIGIRGISDCTLCHYYGAH